MHLTQFSDYSLRLVIYLACHPGRLVSADEIIALSKLPGREGLLSMLLSALTGNMRNFAATVQAVADKKAAEEGAA